MRDFWEFITDAGGWGVASMLAATISFGFGIYEHALGSSVSAWVLASVSVVLFWLGAYKAWQKKKGELAEERDEHEGPILKVDFDFNMRSLRGERSSPLRLSALNEAAFNVQVETIETEGLTAIFEPIACVEVGKPFSVKHKVQGRGGLWQDDLFIIFLKRPEPKNIKGLFVPIATTVKIHYTNSSGSISYITNARFEGKEPTGTVQVVTMTRRTLPTSTPLSPRQRLKRHFR